MQELLKIYDFINNEILEEENYCLNYQNNMSEIIRNFYDNMPEHKEIENYLGKMDYLTYNKLISNKLILFVRDKYNNIAERKREIEYLKIAKNSIGRLIHNISGVKKEDLKNVWERMNYIVDYSKVEEDVNIYNFDHNILSLNKTIYPYKDLRIEEFLNFYINMKYRNGSLNIRDVYNIYLMKKEEGKKLNLTK